MEAVQAYKRVTRVKDERFDIENLAQYTLSLLVSLDKFAFNIVDKESGRALLIEEFRLEALYSTSQVLDQLELIYDDHHFLQAGYWGEIKVAVQNHQFSLIPNSLFDPEQAKQLLAFNCPIDDNEDTVKYYKHSKLDLVNVFACNSRLLEWFELRYPNIDVQVVHQTSPLIEGTVKNHKRSEDQQMFIYCDNALINILIIKDGKLEYCNLFSYLTAEDLTYFTMFVFSELGLNPESTEVTLWGQIDQTSIHFTKLYKFIRYLSFGPRPHDVKFGFVFDEIHDHNHFDILNLHNC